MCGRLWPRVIWCVCVCVLAGQSLRSAAAPPPGLSSWRTLTNTRNWPTTAAFYRNTTIRAMSKVTNICIHTFS